MLIPRSIKDKKPKPIAHTETVTHKEGDGCPRCGGSGSVLSPRDAHRSEGWIPCNARFGKLDCTRGILKHWRGSK
jgi:hypothetical protein